MFFSDKISLFLITILRSWCGIFFESTPNFLGSAAQHPLNFQMFWGLWPRGRGLDQNIPWGSATTWGKYPIPLLSEDDFVALFTRKNPLKFPQKESNYFSTTTYHWLTCENTPVFLDFTMQVQLVKTPLKRGKLAEPIGGFWSSLPLGLRHAFELICLHEL